MPGTGKSAIAKTVASHLGSAYILTATKQLQDQYLSEFPDLVTIKGKNNYTCYYSPSVNCKQAICEKDKSQAHRCKEDGVCPYYNAVKRAANSELTVMSYAYFFAALGGLSKTYFPPKKVLILDECHLLDAQFTSWMSIRLNVNKLNKKYKIFRSLNGEDNFDDYMTLTAMELTDGFSAINEEFIRSILKLLSIRRNVLSHDLSIAAHDPDYILSSDWGDFEDQSNNPKIRMSKLINLRDRLEQLIGQLTKFINAPDKLNKWLIMKDSNREDKTQELIIQPLSIDGLFKQYMSSFGAEHVVLMSATILSARLFCEELGISQDEVGIIRVDSSFDPNKSPIYHLPVGKMNMSSLPQTLPNIIKAVKKILEMHPEDKGIIHTGNYKIAQEIVRQIHNRRLLMKQGMESNEELLERHIRSTNGILVSPSLSTGTDLKDDLSRFQIIVKMPFMSLADKRVKQKSEINSDWYVCEMLRTLIQASGRSTRSENDYAITYILDSSFSYWINQYQAWLPESFLKRIRWRT